MARSLAERPRRANAVTQVPNRVQANVCLYDGSALDVDMSSYLAQHDVVYLAPPLEGAERMPLGDGDIGAMLWCPGRLRFQVQKSDLWSDPSDGAEPSDWRQLSAGAVSLSSSPSFLKDPTRYEQRLCLHSGTVTIRSDNAQGACQATSFVSATAGVLVVHYRDQCVRNVERRVDITLQRDAHLFAVGETAGVLQALRDRRYALMAQVVGCRTYAATEGAGKSSLVMEGARSSDFTLYIAVATSPRDGDPVAMARSRIRGAIAKGFDRLLAEQKQHWGRFWEKSFLRLTGSNGDALPCYLENLWYLGLYQQACCSRGYDAPLANGGLFLSGEESRRGPALYKGDDLRALLASLIPSNHLELSVPYVDTLHRMIPALAARTGSETGLAGVRFPSTFNRLGDDLEHAATSIGPTDHAAAFPKIKDRVLEVTEGLDTALLVFEAWRHAPDAFFLRERVYPLLRASAVFAIERCQIVPELWRAADVWTRVSAALRGLLWANEAFDLEDELRADWEQMERQIVNCQRVAVPALQPFGALKPADTVDVFQSLIASVPQQPNGLFGEQPGSADLAFAARLCSGLNALSMAERDLPAEPMAGRPARALAYGFGGAAPAAIQVFGGLPASWGGAFSMIAPGGFRVSAEAAQGQASYVAVKSLLGGTFRLVNPWGPAVRVRIFRGRAPLTEITGAVIEFPTEPNTAYLIERHDLSFARAATVRLIGKPSDGPRDCGSSRIGIAAKSADTLANGSHAPLPTAAVVSVSSRIERARRRLSD